MEQFDHTRGTYVTATQVSIVRGGRDKLTVKKLGGGGASLFLLSHLMQCSQVPRVGGGGGGQDSDKGGRMPTKMKPWTLKPSV